MQFPGTAQVIGLLILGGGSALNISWTLGLCVEGVVGVGNKMGREQDCN